MVYNETYPIWLSVTNARPALSVTNARAVGMGLSFGSVHRIIFF
jgi:hypothetical protein